jgi:hypothetical protein
MMDDTDFHATLASLLSEAQSNPDLEGLIATRTLLISSAFREKLSEHLRRLHNESTERDNTAAKLAELRFAFRDQLASRTDQHAQTGLVAVGGGTALTIGAVLAAATQIMAFAPLAIVPFAIGAYYGWRGAKASRRLALEISALSDIVTTLEKHERTATSDD